MYRLHGLGRYREALAAAEEAVGPWQALAQSDPEQYQKTYSRKRAKLQRDLQLRGQRARSNATCPSRRALRRSRRPAINGGLRRGGRAASRDLGLGYWILGLTLSDEDGQG